MCLFLEAKSGKIIIVDTSKKVGANPILVVDFSSISCPIFGYNFWTDSVSSAFHVYPRIPRRKSVQTYFLM